MDKRISLHMAWHALHKELIK